MRLPALSPNDRLTGALIEAFLRGHLRPRWLQEWAERLLVLGVDSEAIVYAAANEDLDRDEARATFATICEELGISDDLEADAAEARLRVWLEEVRQGLRPAAHLPHSFPEVRERLGFAGPIVFSLRRDQPDGSNPSGYSDRGSGLAGEAFEAEVRRRLAEHGYL